MGLLGEAASVRQLEGKGAACSSDADGCLRLRDLLETGLWTYRKLVCGPIRPVCGPIGNWFVDLSETGLWTYRKLVRGPIGNRYVNLMETGS